MRFVKPVEAENEITIGGNAVKDFRRGEKNCLTCRAGDLDITIKRDTINVKEGRSVGFLKREEIGWSAEYNFEKVESFMLDTKISRIGVFGDKMPKLMVLGNEVRIKDGRPYVISNCKGPDELKCLKDAGIDVDKNGFLSLEDAKKALQLIDEGKIKLEPDSFTKKHLEAIIVFEKEINRAGDIAKDVTKLRHHPIVNEFIERRNKLDEMKGRRLG